MPTQFRGIWSKKIFGSGGRGITRKPRGNFNVRCYMKRRVMRFRRGSSKILGNRGKFEISSAVGPRAKGLWVPPKPLLFILVSSTLASKYYGKNAVQKWDLYLKSNLKVTTYYSANRISQP